MPVAFAGATKQSTHTAWGREKRKEIAVIIVPPPQRIEVDQFHRATTHEKRENLIEWKYLYNEQSKKNPKISLDRQGTGI